MEIIQGVHQVDGINGNVYLISSDNIMLIDTGMPHNAQNILKYVSENLNRDPSEIKTIVITHHHIDHTGSLYELKNITKAKVAVHKKDAKYVSGQKNPSSSKFLSILFKIIGLFFRSKPVDPDIILQENDEIEGYSVVHTPGHTPGSICLYNPEKNIIFVGDALRFVKGKIEGPPARFTPEPQIARDSIGKISKLNFDVMLSGHGQPLKPNASEKVNEFYKSLKIKYS
jgi:hydroxyacylglutathione hydrolase